MLDDLKAANAYLRWFEKTFSDDIGELIQKLCAALILHRSGKHDKAKYYLADLMLSNLYAIPTVFGQACEHYHFDLSSNYERMEYIEQMPREVLMAITENDKTWIRDLYESLAFRRYKKQYIQLSTELDHTEGVEKRGSLLHQLESILDDLKSACR